MRFRYVITLIQQHFQKLLQLCTRVSQKNFFSGLTLVWSGFSCVHRSVCNFFFMQQLGGVGTSVAFLQRKQLTDRVKIFLRHIPPKTNDNPNQTKVRPEKGFSDTPYCVPLLRYMYFISTMYFHSSSVTHPKITPEISWIAHPSSLWRGIFQVYYSVCFLIGQDLINLGQFTNDLLFPLLTFRIAKWQSVYSLLAQFIYTKQIQCSNKKNPPRNGQIISRLCVQARKVFFCTLYTKAVDFCWVVTTR